MHNYLMIIAVPLFILFMGAEYLLSCKRKEKLYYLNDFINNLSCGMLEQVAMLPFQGLLILSYYYISTHYAFFSINPSSAYSWIALWLGVDFTYYWFHRTCHRNNFLWIGHSVHHQSEQYNLSVALRQGIGQTLTAWVFYLPLGFIGFPAWMLLTMLTLNALYQFWIHTKLIKRMGWFETIFNSPSHHRVHHGVNQRYIDKNYAGSLIIWDKMFGTFEPETETVQYGVTEPLTSWNPFYANIKVIRDTLFYGKYILSIKKRMQAFFMPPEWIIGQLDRKKSDIKQSMSNYKNQEFPKLYIWTNLILCILSYAYLLMHFDVHSKVAWSVGLLLLITLYLIGKILSQGIFPKILYAEMFRSILLLFVLQLFNVNYGLELLIVSTFFFLNRYFLTFTLPKAVVNNL